MDLRSGHGDERLDTAEESMLASHKAYVGFPQVKWPI